MRRYVVLSIVALSVTQTWASTTFYYETTGLCDGLFINPHAKACSEAISKITPPSSASKNFAGYYVGGVPVIDKNGYILVNRSVAMNLFADADASDSDASAKRASAVYTRGGLITVSNATKLENNWFRCGNTAYYTCTQGGEFVPYPSVLCWSGNNHTLGNTSTYDYAFNSWLMGDGTNFVKPSTGFSNGYTNNVASTATGGTKPGWCTTPYLGELTGNSTEGYKSISQIKPFACKKIQSGSTWTTYLEISNGHIELYNGTAGTCTYKITCNSGYQPGTGATETSCSGTACKNYTDGTVGNLGQKGLATTCVQSAGGGGGTTFTCPGDQSITNGKIVKQSGTTSSCKYRPVCNSGYECQGGSKGGNLCTESQTCSDSDSCNTLFNTTYAPVNCVKQTSDFSCRNNFSLGAHMTISEPTANSTAQTCTYTVGCDNGYAFPTGNATTRMFTCTGNQCSIQTDINGLQCKEVLTSSQCSASFKEGNSAAGGINGELSENNTLCRFSPYCPLHFCKTPQNLNDDYCYGGYTVSCETGSGCTAEQNNFQSVSCNTNNLCPDPHDLQKPSIMTISQPTANTTTQTCTYTLGCISGYAIPIAPPHGTNPQTISCTGDKCRTGQYLQSLIDERLNHISPLGRCGKVWSVEACSATYAEGGNAAGTVTTYWNSADYNGTLCVLRGKCDELHECNPGSLGDDYCNNNVRLCGAGGGTESVTQDCLELVQNYKSVSCSADCPSLAKMNSKMEPNIAHFASFSSRTQTATQCRYDVECENGYVSNGQAVCDRLQGCKLNSADWSFPTCSYDYGD